MIGLHDGPCGKHRIPAIRRESAFMAQKVFYCNLLVIRILHDTGVRRIGKDSPRSENSILYIQFALVLKQHYARCSQEFGNRSHPEDIGRLHLHLFFLISPSVALRIDQGVISHDGERRPMQPPLSHIRPDFRIHPCQCRSVGNFICQCFIEPELDSAVRQNCLLLVGRSQ